MTDPERIAPATPPEILVLGSIPVLLQGAERGLVLHRLWEAANPDAFIAEQGPRIRGLATSGGAGADDALLARLPNLEIVGSFGVGYDRADLAALRRRGIILTHTPDVLTEEVADLALGLLIAVLRRLPQADRFVREGRWTGGAWNTPLFPLSPSLRGRRVGIVGLGRIGKAIARRLDASRVEVAYHGRSPQAEVSYPFYPTLLQLAEAVDTLVLAAPGGPETRHMVSAEVLSALGSNGVLINIGRGSLVDEAALGAALHSGAILGAGLDVFEDEPKVPAALLEHENVVVLPHVGSGSIHTRDAMGRLVLDNLIAWFRGEGPLTPVPETPWPPAG